jgi:antitoxin (DNA-binding transcriptional repressor) of toxin-antitoxin stability system
MRAVGIRQLRDRLSDYVRLAASGETVLVTDRHRVVAELTAPAPGRAERATDAALIELIRRGLVTPASVRPGTALPPRHPIMSFEQLMADLDADRADRW